MWRRISIANQNRYGNINIGDFISVSIGRAFQQLIFLLKQADLDRFDVFNTAITIMIAYCI